jgi:hypothetical protein
MADPSPLAAPSYWTQRREEIRDWLRRIDAASLAELYEGAVSMMETRLPGYVRFVGHAVREIANRLPAVIVAEHVSGRVEYQGRLAEIRREWDSSRNFTNPGGASSPALTGASPPVPTAVIAKWRGLLDDDLAASNRVEQSMRDLFITSERMRSGRKLDSSAVEPAVSEWKSIRRWSLGHAHDNGTVDDGVDRAEFRRKFESFELMLSSFFQEYVQALKGTNEILEKANS